MDDAIIHSWCFHDVECFDSTPSVAIIILDEYLESFLSLRSQHPIHVTPFILLGITNNILLFLETLFAVKT